MCKRVNKLFDYMNIYKVFFDNFLKRKKDTRGYSLGTVCKQWARGVKDTTMRDKNVKYI